MNIGSWVRRPEQKWHRVESIIADEPVTHCGRRLKTRYLPNGIKVPFEVSEAMPHLISHPALCKRCA